MAADIYLRIEGIQGESRDAAHAGWMECQHADLGGVSQPASAVCSTGGRTIGRCYHQTIIVAKLADLASPLLMQACAMGKTYPRAKLEFFRADGDKPLRYYEVELENVLIAEVAAGAGEGSPMNEFVALAFSKIKWRYIQQKVGGGAAGCTVGGWDLAANCRA
jgi:type VI secretion system secreted protein Hcp